MISDNTFLENGYTEDSGKERAILVGVETLARGTIIEEKTEGERSLDELEELAHTAGATVVGRILQKRLAEDSTFYIGKGKVEELKELCINMDADIVIFDDELSGAILRNLEDALKVKVIDRAALILDIFSQRAQSREGKLQVELAQLKYRLPRLAGIGHQLSRLGGGIGTRGPGEKKLESDRRHIRRRIKYLEARLNEISKRRSTVRLKRQKNETFTVAIVGYTNAGKSTLMNRLCNSGVFVEDKLFATLDPTTRKLTGENEDILIIDTVGFIRKLPTELIKAFKSTLEEAVYADTLIHVVDASDREYEEHIRVVEKTLLNLGAANKPILIAFNKIDLLDKGENHTKERIPIRSLLRKDIFEISAVTGEGIDTLIEGIRNTSPIIDVKLDITVPYEAGWVLPYVYENGKILEKEYLSNGVKAKILINKGRLERIKNFIK